MSLFQIMRARSLALLAVFVLLISACTSQREDTSSTGTGAPADACTSFEERVAWEQESLQKRLEEPVDLLTANDLNLELSLALQAAHGPIEVLSNEVITAGGHLLDRLGIRVSAYHQSYEVLSNGMMFGDAGTATFLLRHGQRITTGFREITLLEDGSGYTASYGACWVILDNDGLLK